MKIRLSLRSERHVNPASRTAFKLEGHTFMHDNNTCMLPHTTCMSECRHCEIDWL